MVWFEDYSSWYSLLLCGLGILCIVYMLLYQVGDL